MIRLAINGGAGRMGQAMVEGLSQFSDLSVVALIDQLEPRELFGARWARSLEELSATEITHLVDFSVAAAIPTLSRWCATNRVALVTGTTGLSPEEYAELEKAGTITGVVQASNFSLGAVLSERFAVMAAPFFSRIEIIELHHDQKLDAPSGTSLTTARAIGDARSAAGLAPMSDMTQRHAVAGARGAEVESGVRIHSIRLPGLVAHQEVIFGGPGEGLTIRHDSFDRASFVQGVALALRKIGSQPQFVQGIDSFLL
jgi:4-hydroxy-tetrahydrodipicolinate reductase